MLNEKYLNYFKKEISEIQTIIKTNLINSDTLFLESVFTHILNVKGKYIRPIMMLGVSNDRPKGLLDACAAIELIHTATLIHDDVIDESKTRRGQVSLNVFLGNKAAILIGDFLFSKAFEILVKLNNFKILEIITIAAQKLSKGELLQLIEDEKNYLNIISMKTGSLFEAALNISSIICNKPIKKGVGELFGMAFQILDDVNDADNKIASKKMAGDFLKDVIKKLNGFEESILFEFINYFLETQIKEC